jgi:ribosomal 50S subunit-recycling heat shock protein
LQAVKHVEQQRINTSRKDASEMKMDKYLQDKRIVKSRNASVYMYSAIQNLVPNKRKSSSSEEATTAQMSMIVVSGWELNKNQSSNFVCCHMMENGTVIPTSSVEKRNWLYLGMAKLQAKQYTCNTINNNSRTELISIESPGSMCPTDTKYYTCIQTAN